MRRRPQRGRGDRGVALVEFALILPVLMMLLLGMITGGLALNDKQQMNHAAREGARYAAAVPYNQSFTDMGTWADNVRALIVSRSDGALSTGDVCVSLVYESPGIVVGSAGGDPTNEANFTTDPGGNACITNQTYPSAGNDTRVQVTSSKGATIQLGLFGAHDITITSEATAKAETEYSYSP